MFILAFLLSSFAVGSTDLFQQLLSEKKTISKPQKILKSYQYTFFESQKPNRGRLICKPFFVSMNWSEPFSGVFKSEESQFYALINKGNKPEVISSSYSFLQIDMKVKKIPRKLFKFDPYLMGPFQTFEEAAQNSCDSYYKSKLGLIKNHFVKKVPTKNQKFNYKMNEGHSPENLNSSYNQDVDCNFSEKNSVHWQFSPFQTRALLFGLNSQFYAYILPVNLDPTQEPETVYFSGPFPTAEKAAQKSCELQFDETKKIQTAFEQVAEHFDLKKECQLQESATKTVEEKFPFAVKLGLVSKPQTLSLTFQNYLKFAEFTENYRTLNEKQRAEKTKGSELLASAEEYLLAHDQQEMLSGKLAKLKKAVQAKLSQDEKSEQRVLLQYPRKVWKIIYYPKKSLIGMARFHSKLSVSEIEYLKFDDQRRVTIQNKESAIKMICDSAKNLF